MRKGYIKLDHASPFNAANPKHFQSLGLVLGTSILKLTQGAFGIDATRSRAGPEQVQSRSRAGPEQVQSRSRAGPEHEMIV